MAEGVAVAHHGAPVEHVGMVEGGIIMRLEFAAVDPGVDDTARVVGVETAPDAVALAGGHAVEGAEQGGIERAGFFDGHHEVAVVAALRGFGPALAALRARWTDQADEPAAGHDIPLHLELRAARGEAVAARLAPADELEELAVGGIEHGGGARAGEHQDAALRLAGGGVGKAADAKPLVEGGDHQDQALAPIGAGTEDDAIALEQAVECLALFREEVEAEDVAREIDGAMLAGVAGEALGIKRGASGLARFLDRPREQTLGQHAVALGHAEKLAGDQGAGVGGGQWMGSGKVPGSCWLGLSGSVAS